MLHEEASPSTASAFAIEEASQAALRGDGATTDGPRSVDAAADHLWRIYGTINEWIRFADAKAGVILTANVILASTAITGLKGEREFLLADMRVLAIGIVGGMAMLVSACFCLYCILPRTGKRWMMAGGTRTPIFFGHIAEFEDPAAYRDAARGLGTGEGAFEAICRQVWINARLAAVKHRLVRGAIWTMGLGLLCALIVGVAAMW